MCQTNKDKQSTLQAGSAENICSITEISHHQSDEMKDFLKDLSKALTLSVAFAARVGGVGTLTGTVPNMIMKAFADR